MNTERNIFRPILASLICQIPYIFVLLVVSFDSDSLGAYPNVEFILVASAVQFFVAGFVYLVFLRSFMDGMATAKKIYKQTLLALFLPLSGPTFLYQSYNAGNADD